MKSKINLFPAFNMITNYLYLYHVDNIQGDKDTPKQKGTLLVIPSFAENLNDSISANFASTSIMSRTAPIYSYQNSSPRTVQFSFDLHRDMMQQINAKVSNAILPKGEDYVDYFIKAVQAAVLPEYDANTKMVNPPMVAIRMGNEIYIKGIINGGVGLTYKYPIISDREDSNYGKYAIVSVSFGVTEIEPYQASDIMSMGSFRGLDTSLERNISSIGGGFA